MIALLIAAAATVALPFAPPTTRPTFYETEQTRMSGGQPQHFRMVNRLAFSRSKAGWRLRMALVDMSTDARADTAALFEAAMRPFLDVELDIRLDASGRPLEVLDADAKWARVTDALRASADLLAVKQGGDAAAVRATRAWHDQYAALPAAARQAKLMEIAAELIGFAFPALSPGQTLPWSAGTGPAGTIRLDGVDAAHAGYRIATTTVLPQARIDDVTTVRMDRATGLLVTSLSVKKAGDRVLAEERVRRLR